MTDEEIHNIYLHMSGKAEGLFEATGEADFPVLFARAILEYSKSQWQGLTNEEREEIALEVPIDAVSITEAKLKDKNTRRQE
jgi:hypothetical protein